MTTRHDAIAIIDFGGQYAHLIATKIRKLNVLAEIRQPEDPPEAFAPYRGIILSGSPNLLSQGEDESHTHAILALDLPILGLCFGHQEIARHYGGKVKHGGREWGRADLHLVSDHRLFKGLDRIQQVWMSHFDSVVELGPDFDELGYTVLGEAEKQEHRYAAVGSDKLKRYGFQFHPEVDDTVFGQEILANFAFEICGCRPTWTVDNYLAQQLDQIRQRVGNQSVFLLISGGVDSTVAAKLFQLALGPERVCLLHVDNGLMRLDESQKVIQMLEQLDLGQQLHFIDATDDFLGGLAGETEPEKKREIIGNTFIDVFQREAERLGIADHLLGQGTIYPDTIETGGTKRADTIKTHHNRVPIIDEMIAAGKVIEPIAELYKAEVRELGARLGIPDEQLNRHPFPGPGLGVRLLCSDGTTDQDQLDQFAPGLAAIAGRYDLEALALPVRSVGVKGDVRSYEHPVMFSGQASWSTLLEASGAVFREVLGINRCVWNLSPTAPKKTRLLSASVTRPRLDLLRQADQIVMEGLRRFGLYGDIWQCPTVLVPLQIDGRGEELVIVRPIYSKRAMTAVAAELPAALIEAIQKDILALSGVSGLAIDLTSKPPGTIEWE